MRYSTIYLAFWLFAFAPVVLGQEAGDLSTTPTAVDAGATLTATIDEVDTAPAQALSASDEAEEADEDVPRKMGWLKIIGLLLLAAVLLTAVGIAGLMAYRYQEAARFRDHEEDQVTPLDRLTAEMTVLERKAQMGESQDFAEKTEKWVKTLLMYVTDSDMRRATLGELRERLSGFDQLPENAREMTLSILERCEEVRFASQQPSREQQEDLYKDCTRLLEACRGEFSRVPKSLSSEDDTHHMYN